MGDCIGMRWSFLPSKSIQMLSIKLGWRGEGLGWGTKQSLSGRVSTSEARVAFEYSMGQSMNSGVRLRSWFMFSLAV